MAAYGSGYYGGGNFSYGVSLGEASSNSASSIAVAGAVLLNASFDVNDSSTVAATAVTVKDSSFAISSASSATASGQRVALGAGAISDGSVVGVVGVRIGIGDMAVTNEYVATPYSAFGNAQLSTAQQKFGASSIAFDGSGDYIRSPTTVPAFENSDFTVEMWVRPNSSSSASYIFDHRQSGGVSLRTSSTSLWVGVGGYIAINISSAFPTPQVWYHIAITRSGNNTKCFINGVQKGSTYTTAYTASAASLYLGAPYTAISTFFNGYIDEFRVSNVARYATTFTPPTSAFDYDLNTLVLLHADGANGSTVIEDSIEPPAILIAGVRYAVGVAGLSSSSNAGVVGQRVAFVSAVVGSDTEISVSSNVIVNQALTLESTSTAFIDGRNIIDFAFAVVDAPTIVVDGNLKWISLSDTPESWSDIADTSESWTGIADTNESWSAIADGSTSWTPVSDNTEIWQQA